MFGGGEEEFLIQICVRAACEEVIRESVISVFFSVVAREREREICLVLHFQLVNDKVSPSQPGVHQIFHFFLPRCRYTTEIKKIHLEQGNEKRRRKIRK